MSTPFTFSPTLVRDQYREYFSAKLWEWVPAIYRELDGQPAPNGGDGALRAFVESLAEQAALLKRDQDRLWDNAYVELADDWALPYLAELVGTRLVSALNSRARRADVAKTIYYRRRKGTLAVLEQLIADMTGWDGKVVEQFRRLARTRHGLDGVANTGRISATPEGGLADLRSVRGALLAGTHGGGDPFEEFHYTPDVRRPHGVLGQRGITKLSFYLYRQQSVEWLGVRPFLLANLGANRAAYSFDPSGRDVALFCAPDSNNGDAWRSADEWELPRPITCRLLGEERFTPSDVLIAWVLDTSANGAPIANLAQRQAAAQDLNKLRGQNFPHRSDFIRVLGGMPSSAVLTQAGVLAGLVPRALSNDCGSVALLPDASGNARDLNGAPASPALGLFYAEPGFPYVPRERTQAARLDTFPAALPANTDALIEPQRGRFVLNTSGHNAANLRVRYRTGMAAPIGAGAYGREISNAAATGLWSAGSSAAGTPANGVAHLMDSETYVTPPNQAAVINCTVRAAEGQRPYLNLTNDWQFTASGTDRTLLLDGLWLGSRQNRHVVLNGNFEQVSLRYCSLDPGGVDAQNNLLTPVHLVIQGFVEKLVIERSMLASIRLQGANAAVEQLILSDSILHARVVGSVALNLPRSRVQMERCTVIAPDLVTLALDVEGLSATDSVVAGLADVTDTQNGCFRFSARLAGSRVPFPYQSVELSDLARLFASRRFGDAAYASLSSAAPLTITRGAENGSEMGAFSAEIASIKYDSLRSKVDEYLPFGRLPNFVEVG